MDVGFTSTNRTTECHVTVEARIQNVDVCGQREFLGQLAKAVMTAVLGYDDLASGEFFEAREQRSSGQPVEAGRPFRTPEKFRRVDRVGSHS